MKRFIPMSAVVGVAAVVRPVLVAGFTVLVAGCGAKPESDVVLFATVEQETAMPILGAFERTTDDAVGVTSRFDADPGEASTLMKQIVTAKSSLAPCDVVWNRGVMETVRLQKLGRLQHRKWPIEPGWPKDCLARDKSWCGFAATARVILVNTQLLGDPAEYPHSVLDLADEKWQGRCAIGMPTIGNTATQFAVLRNQLGHDEALKLVEKIQAQTLVLPGSRQVAIAVSAGQAAWGVTDSDAAITEVELRHPVAIIFPDQGPSQFGTLRIPSTTAVVKDAANPVAAGMFADYLIQPVTEERLSMGNGSVIPLSRNPKFPSRVLNGDAIRWMNADFELAGEGYDEWLADVRNRFDKP